MSTCCPSPLRKFTTVLACVKHEPKLAEARGSTGAGGRTQCNTKLVNDVFVGVRDGLLRQNPQTPNPKLLSKHVWGRMFRKQACHHLELTVITRRRERHHGHQHFLAQRPSRAAVPKKIVTTKLSLGFFLHENP